MKIQPVTLLVAGSATLVELLRKVKFPIVSRGAQLLWAKNGLEYGAVFHNSITVIFNVLIFCSPHLHN